MTLHFLNDVAYDAESTKKIENYFIIPSLKSETMGKVVNRISGLRLDFKFTRLGFENPC